MRLIDADKIVYTWVIDADGEEHDGITLQSIIKKIPTIDAVEVVRCKDCVFGRTGEKVGVGKWNIDCLNPNISKYRLPTDYCSYGKRREE